MIRLDPFYRRLERRVVRVRLPVLKATVVEAFLLELLNVTDQSRNCVKVGLVLVLGTHYPHCLLVLGMFVPLL